MPDNPADSLPIEVNRIIRSYEQMLADATRRAIIAEAQVAALLSQRDGEPSAPPEG